MTIIQQIAQAYGLGRAVVAEPQKGYRNTSYRLTLASGEQRNVIVYKSEPGMLERIGRANLASDTACQQGLPARRTLDKTIKLHSPSRTSYAALYTYLPGETIAWEAYTKDHIKALGLALSTLHAALAGIAGYALPDVTDEYLAIQTRMRHYFSDKAVQAAMRTKLGISLDIAQFKQQKALLKACKRLPDQQALHMDFVRGNILFRQATEADRLVVGTTAVSGILDFEKTAYGHPLFDIARTLAFLLVDCKHKDTAAVRKYFLYSGYTKRGPVAVRPLTVRDGAARFVILEALVDMFLLYDFYKFLRHNPYEFLHQNEHYVRTKDILIQHKLLVE